MDLSNVVTLALDHWQPLAALGTAIGFQRHLRRAGKRTYRVLTILPGALEQLVPNGGRSVVDRVGAIETRTTTMAQQFETMARRSSINGTRIDRLVDLSERPTFECEPDGRLARVSESFTRATGWSTAEMADRRWIRILHEDDRPEVLREYRHAVDDGRASLIETRIVTRAGAVMDAVLATEPSFDETGVIIRRFGTLTIKGLVQAVAS